jgi:hypothetical protein
LVLTLVVKFGASSHIDGTPALAALGADWLAVDYSVRSLIYYLLWPRVMHLIMETGVSAHTV